MSSATPNYWNNAKTVVEKVTYLPIQSTNAELQGEKVPQCSSLTTFATDRRSAKTGFSETRIRLQWRKPHGGDEIGEGRNTIIKCRVLPSGAPPAVTGDRREPFVCQFFQGKGAFYTASLDSLGNERAGLCR